MQIMILSTIVTVILVLFISSKKFSFIGKKSLKYVALGDSIATGTGADKGYTKRYKDYLEEKYQKRVEYLNQAKNGCTSRQLLDSLKQNKSLRKHLKNADFVSWNIGGNDFLYCYARAKANLLGGESNQQCYVETLEEFKDNWVQIVNEIKSLTPNHAQLTTITNYLSFESWDNDVQLLKNFGILANNFIKNYALENDIILGNAADDFNGLNLSHPARNLLFIDSVHPNEEGHKVISDSLIYSLNT